MNPNISVSVKIEVHKRPSVTVVAVHGVDNPDYSLIGDDAAALAHPVRISFVKDNVVVLGAYGHLCGLGENVLKSIVRILETVSDAVPGIQLAVVADFFGEYGILLFELAVAFTQVEVGAYVVGGAPYPPYQMVRSPIDPYALQL